MGMVKLEILINLSLETSQNSKVHLTPVEIQRDANGNIIKYTEYGPDGEFVKEVRLTGKEHGNIPRPNVKEPNFNVNPRQEKYFIMDIK